MPRFSYKALNAVGQIKIGAVTAGSRSQAEIQLQTGGLVVLDLEQRVKRKPLGLSLRLESAARPRRRAVILFTRELSTLLGAGLPLDRSLQLLSEQGDGPMQRITAEILERVSGGDSLSEAFARDPDIFSPFYVGMVRSGEAGGNIASAMAHLYEMLDKQEQMVRKVRSAMTYPTLVLALTALSVVVLLALVIPQFRPLFERSLNDLPLSTRAILAASEITLDYGIYIALVLLLAGVIVARLPLPQSLRVRRDRMLLALPYVGPMIRALEVGRFCRILGTLRQSGLTMIEAMPIATGTIRNASLGGAVSHAEGPLARGEGLSAPLSSLQVLPPIALEMIAVGEESGKLDEMLLEAAAVLDDEADRKIQSALSLLLPAITVVLGIIVAGVIGSILSAILNTYRIAL